MNYPERLQNAAILGAAGKMGSGITLLTALEMADQALKPENQNRNYTLWAVDVSETSLHGLMKYLKSQILKAAEKKTVALRGIYSHREDLVENADIIQEYVSFVMGIVRPVTRIENACDALIIFEAASENPSLKVNLFKSIESVNHNKPWYLTNTSSIPISYLEKEAGIAGRIAGFHFYNPPAVQKLVEMIYSDTTGEELKSFALRFAGNLRKTIVYSNDKAGFIGNGHFMRDILHAAEVTQALTGKLTFTQALWAVNRVSQELLVRPMGIFQLIDYVGIDVCRYIMQVMNPYYPGEDLHSLLLDRFFQAGIRGGQHPDGSQKDGIFRYEKGRPVAVFHPDTGAYEDIGSLQNAVKEFLGKLPDKIPAWKEMIRSGEKEKTLIAFFQDLKQTGTEGARLAEEYATASRRIAERLVSEGVALKAEDVNTVLMTGFFHAYGPINSYFESTTSPIL